MIVFEHNFGNIAAGTKAKHVFRFKNTGTGDLIISSVSTSCGCTVPKFKKKPIPPGGEATLEVIFDSSGTSGYQLKTVEVLSNAFKKLMVLKITAEVIPK